MRPRKPLKIEKALLKKGFKKTEESHHTYYILWVNGKKTDIYTYLSHGKSSKDYGSPLMGKVKSQLRFKDNALAEDFFDCPMTEGQYLKMLKELDAL